IETNTEPILDKSGGIVAAVASISDITDQRDEQRQLRRSRERLAAIIDASPPGIMTVDMEGRVTSWSLSCERIFGWTEEEVLGRPNPTVPEQMRNTYVESIAHWDDRRGGRSREMEVLRKDGSMIPVSISVAPLRAEGEQVGALGIMQDVSPRRRAERQQREERQHLSAVLQSSPLPIVTVDLEGRVLSWNQAAEDLFGWTEGEVIGEYNPLLVEEREEPFRQLLKDVVTDGGTHLVQTHSRRRDGSRIPVEVSVAALRDSEGNARGAVGVHLDVSARVEAQRREREHQARLEAILGSSPFAIITVDLEGRVISWNQAAEKLFGWTEEEALGQLNPAVLPEKHDLYAEIMGELGDGCASRTQDTSAMHRDGSRIPVQVSIAPLYDASGEVSGAVAIHEDIRERQQAEERIRESRARYRGLFEHSPVGIAEFDFSGLGPIIEMMGGQSPQESGEYIMRHPETLDQCVNGMRLIDANPALLNLHEASSVEELRERLPEIFGPEAGEVLGQGIALLAAEWTIFDLTMPLRTLDGQQLQTLVRLQVVPGYEEDLTRVIVTTIDISDREEAREELQRSNRLLEATLGSMDDAVVVVDSHRRILSCNEATVEIFGYAEDDLVGNTARRLYSSDESFEAIGRQAKPILAEGGTHRTEMTMTRADGSEFLAEIITSPLDRSKGWLGGVVSVIRDVTESRELQERLSQARRMEAVGQLAGGVAHDFNNMLTVIVGNLGMALRNVEDTEAVHDQVSQSLDAARRTAKLTNQLLAFSRKQVLAPETLDIDQAVAELERLLSRTIPESIEVLTDLNAAAPVYFDPAQIDQIVMNLAVNARDAMPEGGLLTIGTESVTVGDEGLVPAELAPGDYVRLSVGDTGVGMDEETRAHIFEPFFSTKLEGRGLGLAAAYGIVKNHSGHIAASSEK
ncbi:MAG: PAS domain S-box protein, partial [Armatimonadia bacterium]|nr:PAS domain S-box protein [Armatimonadia bacterium]